MSHFSFATLLKPMYNALSTAYSPVVTLVKLPAIGVLAPITVLLIPPDAISMPAKVAVRLASILNACTPLALIFVVSPGVPEPRAVSTPEKERRLRSPLCCR